MRIFCSPSRSHIGTNSSKDFEVRVFFVDEGFYSVVGPSHLRPLEKKFASKLPWQSFHCVLGGVQPIGALKNKENLGFSMWAIKIYIFFVMYRVGFFDV